MSVSFRSFIGLSSDWLCRGRSSNRFWRSSKSFQRQWCQQAVGNSQVVTMVLLRCPLLVQARQQRFKVSVCRGCNDIKDQAQLCERSAPATQPLMQQSDMGSVSARPPRRSRSPASAWEQGFQSLRVWHDLGDCTALCCNRFCRYP
jgi:hypothetical protein